jgi:flagellar hook-basal body complex protein FliE
MNNTIPPLRILPAEVEPVTAAKPEGEGFLETLHGALEDVDQLQGQAQAQVSQMLSGTGLDVHKAMIAVEKADLAFQLMLQVRNKIVQAYQEVARMQF